MSQVNSLETFSARLRQRILAAANLAHPPPAAAGGPQGTPEWPDFSQLALELFELQFERNSAYRRLCEHRAVRPGTLDNWNQIPAVPTLAFKDCELSCISREEQTAVFLSSGTTEHKPSRHIHNRASLDTYEASLTGWYRLALGRLAQAGMTGLALSPTPAQAPNSSLVHMFETLRCNLSFGEFHFTGAAAEDKGWVLDCQQTVRVLERAQGAQTPMLVLGTAFSYVHLLDYLAEERRQLWLPDGSQVLETGGYKGRSRELPKSELHSLICRGLGVRPAQIICEYGMSELSSQAYDAVKADEQTNPAPNGRLFRFPPWAKVRIVSPETGRPVSQGEPGLIQVFDLANVYSVMAVQTDDLGIRGSSGFELLGRAALAEPRGCSLMFSE